MGFETQEEAERWAENMEFLADQRKEEAMLRDPQESAWLEIASLPAFSAIDSDGVKALLKTMHKAAWGQAMKHAMLVVKDASSR